ncbi:MAG: DUF3800 domain-containing protein [Pseudomonadota bacterium]|nr:DUF3800 domain-containing protein [Pseudomonadota bacterium]
MNQDRSHKRPLYRIYIDESGDHTYKHLDDSSRRFLALLGVWFRQKEYVAFAEDLDKLKKDVFGPRPDKPVVLHRSDMINRKGPFGMLRDSQNQIQFDDGLLEIVNRAQFKMICVVIDKKKHQDRYTSPFHPYHYCLAAMLERYAGWLEHFSLCGDVMAESRGRVEDMQLKQAYRRIYESGTYYHKNEQFQRVLTSKDIKMRSKKDAVPGLELADILAHPVKQVMLVEKGIISEPGENFGKRLYEASQEAFNKNFTSKIVEGYGKVLL